MALTATCAAMSIGPAAEASPFADNETVRYVIKKLKMKVGEAKITFRGEAELNHRKVYLIVFRAEGFRFFDQEKIYVDPVSFLPVQVERDVDIFGKKEKITEYYGPAGKVRIVKIAGGKRNEQVIVKDGPIENIYGFIYRYRLQGSFAIGSSLKMSLPTKDVTMKVVEPQTVKAGGQKYKAYFLESDPNQYRIWFDAGPGRIPLRIDGAVGFGDTAMVMEEYHPGKIHPQ